MIRALLARWWGQGRAQNVSAILPALDWDDFKDWNGRCPDCGGTEWYDGPEGGLCINVQCANAACAALLNVRIPGKLMAQRIDPRRPPQAAKVQNMRPSDWWPVIGVLIVGLAAAWAVWYWVPPLPR